MTLLENRLEADRQRAAQALQEASARATEQQDGLQRELDDCQAACAELEAKVARAATSLKAADDLKEARWVFTSGSTIQELYQLVGGGGEGGREPSA